MSPRLSLSVVLAACMLLLQLVSANLLPEGEHIGTPSPFHPQGEHIGTPSPSIPDSMAALSAPRIPESASAPHIGRRRHHSKGGKSIGNGKVTYYFGSQLLNPACPGAPTPNDGSMTAAISFDSPFECGDRIKITNSEGKHAIVTVVDRCAGCSYNWIDVTKGVFRVFSDLDAGVLRDVSFTKQ